MLNDTEIVGALRGLERLETDPRSPARKSAERANLRRILEYRGVSLRVQVDWRDAYGHVQRRLLVRHDDAEKVRLALLFRFHDDGARIDLRMLDRSMWSDAEVFVCRYTGWRVTADDILEAGAPGHAERVIEDIARSAWPDRVAVGGVRRNQGGSTDLAEVIGEMKRIAPLPPSANIDIPGRSAAGPSGAGGAGGASGAGAHTPPNSFADLAFGAAATGMFGECVSPFGAGAAATGMFGECSSPFGFGAPFAGLGGAWTAGTDPAGTFITRQKTADFI